MKVLIEKLLISKKPIIHLGHGVRDHNTKEIILKFIERTNIPVMTTWNATDVIASDSKYFIGRPGAFAKRGANFNIQNCDFYLSVGTRLPFMVTGYNKCDFAKNAYKIMVDIDKNELNKHLDFIDLAIESDAYEFINKLDALVPLDFACSKKWLDKCKIINKKYPLTQDYFVKQDDWVYSYYFIDKLSEFADKNYNIVTDMGLSFVGTHMGFNIKEGQNVFTNSGHAPMGWGLPSAIGSFFSQPNKKIICLTGEGGLMMNLQELATVMHNKIPMKIFIYNNGGYQTIKDTQILGFQGRLMGCDENSGISFPKFDKIANSFGIEYIKIRNNFDVETNLKDILNSEVSCLVELMIDPDQQHIPKAINRRDNTGKTIPSNFEDLYPFLSKEELKSNLD